MKSTFYRKILRESSIEMNESADQAIKRLRQLNNRSTETDGEAIDLWFDCSKDGCVKIGSLSYSTNCICGYIVDNSGKATVQLYEICDYSRIILRWVIFVLCIALVICSFTFGEVYFWIALAFLAIDLVELISTGLSEKRNKIIDFEIMRDEMMKRLGAAEKWDD